MLGLPLHHIGYVVSDIRQAVGDAVERLGVGPFYLAEHMEFEDITFRGRPARFLHSSAFGQWGPVRVELTEIYGTDPPELGQMMSPAGPGHVGHVGILVDSLGEAGAQLEAAGAPAYHSGRTGPVSVVWHDTRAQLGHSVELLERNEFIDGLYEHIARAADGWDGADALRDVSSIVPAA